MDTDGEVCQAAAKAWHPPRSIPPREKSAGLEALQSGRDRLTLLFGSPFALPLGEVLTQDDKGAGGARVSAELCCALRLELSSAGRPFLPGLCICNLNLIP